MKKITFPYRGRPRVKRWLALLSFACMSPVLHANSNPEAGIGSLAYCTPAATSTSYFIKNFSTTGGFTNINNLNTGQGMGGYANHTDMIVSQSIGGSVNFRANYGTDFEETMGLRIWIDWNNNETFEDFEKVYNDITMIYYQSQHVGTITIPVGTPVGSYRMRVLADYDEMNPPSPCQFKNGRGEAEDYTFEVVAPHPTCMPPTILATSVTATTAQLSWQDEGTVFDVEYGPEGFTQGTGTMVSSVGNPYGVSGLTPDTAYQFYVRKDCGTGDKSPWAGPFRFYTGYCTPVAISTSYFINSFTTTSGFANINNTGTTIGTGGYSNYTAQKVSHYEGGAVSFSAAYSGGGSGFAIWIDWNNNLIFDTDERVFNTTGYLASCTGSITVPAGTPVGNYRMRIRIDYDNNNLLDACNFSRRGRGEAEDYTFEVVPTPPCLPPTDLDASSATFTAVQLSWLGIGTVFDVEYGPAGFTQGTGTLVSSVSTPYDATGLTPETAYQFYVRMDCGTRGKSAWTGPFRFFSGYCIPVATGTSNYIRDFSTTGGYANITNLNTGQGTGGYANHTAMIVSKNEGGTVSFSAANNGGAFGLAIWIDWNKNVVFEPSERMFNTTVSTATPTGTITVPTGTPMGNYRMRVLADRNKGNPDNPCVFTNGKGEIEEYTFQVTTPPTCMPPAALGANVTTTTAQLSWTSSGTLFDVEYGPAGFTQGTGTMASPTGTSYAISGLTPDTAYQFYVRTDCGSGDKSTWSGPFPFFTGYCRPTAVSTSYFINSFTTTGGSVNINNTGTTIETGGYSNYTVQKVSCYEGASVNFAAAYSGGSGFAIWIDWNNNMAFDTGERVFNSTAVSSSSTGSIAVPAGTPIRNYRMRVLVDYDSNSPMNPCGFTSGNGEAEDYTFEVTAPPSCLPPRTLAASGTTTTAELSWTSSGTVFDIEYGPRGFVQGLGTQTTGIANPHSIAGLTAATQYQFYVRTDCGAGGKSTWAGPFSFNTTCGTRTVPYLLDFNAATVPAAPLCTSFQNAGTGNNWATQSLVNQYGYNSIILSYKNHYEYPIENPANAWFFTNALQLESGTNYVLKFQYGNSGGASFIESMKVNIGTAADYNTMTRNLVDYPAIANNTPLESSTEFTVATSGVYYLGFNAYSAAARAWLFVDNIAVDVSLSTPEFGASAFKAYPNPVKDLLHLEYSQEITEVAVFNMVGQQLIATSIQDSKGQIDLSALPSGTYLVKARTADSSTKTLKVIKQ